jgi:hypothetical protein
MVALAHTDRGDDSYRYSLLHSPKGNDMELRPHSRSGGYT